MLRLACSDLTGYCPFHVAADLGLWRDAEVVFRHRVPSRDRDRMFAQGKVDLKTTSLHAFVARPDSGKIVAPLLAVAPPGIERLVLGPRCQDLQSLESARIVYLPGDLEHFYLYYFFRHLGAPWPPAERRIEVDDRRTMLDLFRRREADVCITYGEGLAALGRAPNTVVHNLPYEAPVFLATLVVSSGALECQPTDVRALVEGYFEAVEALSGRLGTSKQEDARLAVLRHYGGPWNRIEEQLSGYAILSRDQALSVLRGTTDPSMAQRIGECARIWQELGVITSLPDPSTLFEDILSSTEG